MSRCQPVADVAIRVGADAQHILTVKLLGGVHESRVFEQFPEERRVAFQHHRPVPLRAIEWLVRVLRGHRVAELFANGDDFVRREQLFEDDVAERVIEVELFGREIAVALRCLNHRMVPSSSYPNDLPLPAHAGASGTYYHLHNLLNTIAPLRI